MEKLYGKDLNEQTTFCTSGLKCNIFKWLTESDEVTCLELVKIVLCRQNLHHYGNTHV